MENDGSGNPEVTLIVIHEHEVEVQLGHQNELRTEDAVIVVGFNELGFKSLRRGTGEGSEEVDNEVFETNDSE